MVDQKAGVLLYPSKPLLRYCKAPVREGTDLKLMLIFEQISNDVVLYKKIRSMDMSAEEFGVFKAKSGTPIEYENCMA